MPSSLRSALTRLRRFRTTLCGKFRPPEAGRVFAEALKTSTNSLKKEVMAVLKVGDRIVVAVKVTQIIEDKHGLHYMVEPISGDYYQSMKVTKEDIKSIVE